MTLAHAAHRRLYENQAAAFRSLSTQVTESSVELIEVDIFYNLGTGGQNCLSGFGAMGGNFFGICPSCFLSAFSDRFFHPKCFKK